MRMLSFASIAASLLVFVGGASTSPALAQTDGPAAAAAPAAGADAAPAKKKRKSKSKDAATDAAAPAADKDAAKDAAPADAGAAPAKGKRKKKGQTDTAPTASSSLSPGDALAPPPPKSAPTPVVVPTPAAPQTVTVMIKAPPPAAAPEVVEPVQTGPYDDDPPTISHTAIAKAMKNKPLVFTARITDASGVFQPVLYLRKRGSGDYIPIKMIGSKLAQGEYAVEVDAKLISVDLEYYIECYDNVGNGPARAGSPETPLTIKLEEEKKAPVIVGKQEKVEEKHPGAPPAISHSTIAKAYKGAPIEINAKLVGDTGVSAAKVFFRHSGEHDFRTLPMGNIGGDDFTATMPASVVTGDLEYYLEAYDQYGNGPGRSGGPNVPYQITVTEKPAIAPPAPGQPALPEKPQPHLVKIPFSPNPGRWVGWIFMGGFAASTLMVGGEMYGAWSADQAYQQTYSYSGRIDPALHARTIAYDNRAKYFGIAAGASLAVSITLLLIFPAHAESQMVTGNGDVALAHF